MQQIKLSIPEPCHEGWDNMTPSEKGRFCSSCQKEVIDFTGMTDAEVFAFFTQKQQGSVCGRTHISQLDTPIAKPVVHTKRRFWYLQYAASLLLLLTKPGGAKAQVKPPVTVTPPHPIRMGTVAYVQPVEQATTILKGRVVDENGEPIANASVTTKGRNHGVATDKDGRYQLRIQQNEVLVISAIGYDTEQITYKKQQDSITTTLKMNRSTLEGEVVVVGNISSNTDDAIGYDVPRYKSLLQVKDNSNNRPLAKASIIITRDDHNKQQQVQTNSKGEYLLRKIKADETYTISISAEGYQTKQLSINGNQLKSGNNAKIIWLEKEPMVKTLGEVVVNCVTPPDNNNDQPSANIYMTSGLMSGPMTCKEVPSNPTQQLQSNQAKASTSNNVALQGKVGGIIVQPAISNRSKPNFFQKIFSKSGANSKAVIQKPPANTPAPINIYPNPAKINGPLVIAFETAPKGSYRLQLMDMAGKAVQQTQISVPDAVFNFQWQLDGNVTAGTYVLNITDSKGQTHYNSKIILIP